MASLRQKLARLKAKGTGELAMSLMGKSGLLFIQKSPSFGICQDFWRAVDSAKVPEDTDDLVKTNHDSDHILVNRAHWSIWYSYSFTDTNGWHYVVQAKFD